MTEADSSGRTSCTRCPEGSVGATNHPILEDRDDIDATYWGGALFALLADVQSRVASGGARSLDDAMRLVGRRDGPATRTARVADFLRTADEATGAHEVSAVYESWAVRGENVDLGALWGRLGIRGIDEARVHGTPVTLRDDAPLSAIRRAISASVTH